MEKRLVNKLVKAMELKKGQIALLNFWGEEQEKQDLYDFASALAAEGVMPMLMLHTPEYEAQLFNELEGEVPEKWFQQMEIADVVIDLMNRTPGMPPEDLEKEKRPQYGAYLQKIFSSLCEKEKFIQITMPTKANAAMVGMDFETYKERMIAALDIDYVNLKAECNHAINQYEGTARTIHTGKDCVLTMDTTDRKWFVDAGDGSLPCGEIYIAPVEEKTNGSIFFEHLELEEMGSFKDVTMKVENGHIVDLNCQEFNEFLKEIPEGGDIVAELGIGMNPNVDRMKENPGLDENAIGTFHIGIGMNHLFGGKNKCPLHMDFVTKGKID